MLSVSIPAKANGTPRVTRPANIHHFTDKQYKEIAEKILNAFNGYELRDSALIRNVVPYADITVNRYVSGHWITGGSFDYGPKERIWKTTGVEFCIDVFEYFDERGNEIKHDLDIGKLEAILNIGSHV